MIKGALEYLIGLGLNSNPIVKVDGRPYSLEQLHPVKESSPAALGFNFLDSLVTYLRNNIDPSFKEEGLIIEIKSPTEVALHTEIVGDFNQRFNPVVCTALVNPFPWDKFIDPDSFIIMAQSRFVETDDLAKIRSIVGNVRSEEVAQFCDDGISQQVTTKSGIARVENVTIPPRVKLAPYRTFMEIEQPESEFIFRAKKGDGLPYFALFEADGGAWRIDAMKRIKAYLEDQLKEIENVVILG
ncbi:MAG: hypothetical protein GXY34_05230 [Syntrophomonadaceae bacterium]|nr:hypothetical protein [Syntrophomonadaceae bacterium]